VAYDTVIDYYFKLPIMKKLKSCFSSSSQGKRLFLEHFRQTHCTIFFSFLLTLFFLPAILFAQNTDRTPVTGVITGPDNAPLAGATVTVKGTTIATSSNANGVYTIRANSSDILVFTFVGYERQEKAVGKNSTVNVTLATAGNTNLDQVVVLGYSSQRKKDITGAVSTISTKDIASLPVGGIDQIMQGKASGVAITQATGAPGAGVSMIIRGQASFNNSTPLYIIDGIPTQDGINEISPYDIESINVLKDASAASIYGARAANGVVVITTKKGSTGRPRLSFNTYWGVQTPVQLIKMANAGQYFDAYNTAAVNDNVLGGSQRALLDKGMLDTLPNVNWEKEVLRNALITNNQLSIAGGNEYTKYIVSASYFNQDGMIINSGYKRFNFRTSVTSKLSSIFNVGTNVNLAYGKNTQVGSSGDGYSPPGGANAGASVMRYALFRTPTTPVTYSTGELAGKYVDLPQTVNGVNVFGDGLNPVGLAANTDRNFNNYTLLGDVFVEITPIKNLKIKSDLGTNLVFTDYKQFYPTWGGYDGRGPQNSPNALNQSNTTDFTYNWTNTAIYDWTRDKHTINALVGTEIIYNNNKIISASQNNFPSQLPQFQYLNNGTSLTPGVGGIQSNWALSSVFAKIGYQYDNKYLASFNFRRDGSSRLDPSNQWGNFFSGSVGWRIDREGFMKNMKNVSLLKLRASLGQLGDQNALSNYGYASLVGSHGYSAVGGVPALAYTITSLGNPNLKWQTTTMANIGLDLGMFNNALTFTAEYYHKTTSDLLQNPFNPTSAGNVAAPAYANNGKVLNRGFEFTLGYNKRVNDNWAYNISGNLTTLHNEVLSLLNNQPLPAGRVDNNTFATSTAVGHPIGAFYLIEQEGIFQNPLDVFTHANQGAGIRPGDVKYRDVNSDGVIDQNDRVFAGSPIPNLIYALTGNVSYKQFDLSLFFQGVSGDKIYNQVAKDIDGFYRPFNVTEKTATESWHGEGTSNSHPLLSWADATNNTRMSTRFLENGSYLKLKNLQVGYTIKPEALARMKVSSMRFFISVQNVFTITKYTGLDPEMTLSANAAAAGDGSKALNIDWGTYPSARVFTAGASINF